MLSDIIDGRGKTLYSSINTLKRGNLYLMGSNPGGTKGNDLRDHLDKLENQTDNEYDKGWGDVQGEYDPGEHHLQLNVKHLLEKLDYGYKEVCASNLIFQGSKNQNEINYNKLANLCWPVHQIIIDIIQPKVILVFGNGFEDSPYAYIKKKHSDIKKERPTDLNETFPADHSNWKIKTFKTDIFEFNHDVTIIGIPHLSRYHIRTNKQNVIQKIKEIHTRALKG